ncbi:hypothetical protein MNBD_GAMMA18-902 [hydrothermal vent metagenome]|uniref:DUF4382 domain-containing protein n=1 Tax=hydrothermal vent metagenome TaxID=652676 RepID=A0A3B0Z523_9ZZZZ
MLSTNKAIGYLIASTLLIGCSGDTDLTVNDGGITLAITDAAVDDASAIVIEFSSIEFKPRTESSFVINLDPPKRINLLALQGGQFELLLSNKPIDSGTYSWIRLKVNALENTMDSYVVSGTGGNHSLYMPSSNEAGLTLNQGFTISATGGIHLTIDFDLRKSITAPELPDTNYILKPSLRQVMTNKSGHIRGTVSSEAMQGDLCTGTGYAVYAYEGLNITPDDVDNIGVEPITTSLLTDTTFAYSLGFLAEGSYTIAFTCDAANDLPGSSETLKYIGITNITVTAGQTVTHDF